MNNSKKYSERVSMYPYSFDLIGGLHHFAELVSQTENFKARRYYNAACVTFAAAAIEATVNEQISLNSTLGKDINNPDTPDGFFLTLAEIRKHISLKDKWNLFVSVLGGNFWDSSQEPFQSYDLIIALRNELVHYKAEFLQPLKPPNKKITQLINMFHRPSEDQENISWSHAILESEALADWVKQTIDYGTLLDNLLIKKPDTRLKQTGNMASSREKRRNETD